jgi:pimeloyl-[acyl-carrier protein] synthase
MPGAIAGQRRMTAPAPDPFFSLRRENREAIYRDLRERTPVYWSPFHGGWVLTGYGDIRGMLHNANALAPDTSPFLTSLTARAKLDLSNLQRFNQSLSLLTRPPRHAQVRRVLSQAIGGIRKLNLAAFIEEQADMLLAAGAREGVIDLAAGFGREIPLRLIGRFLGVPDADLPALGRIAAGLIAIFERNVPSIRSLTALNGDAGTLMDYFARLIAMKRKQPGYDGISLIIQLADRELACADEELAGYCTFFFIAAEETTGAAISHAALTILERPSLRAALTGSPERIIEAVPELLRLSSPVQYVARQAGIDLIVGNQAIRAGEIIMLMLGAANRDPTVFSDPEEFLLRRSAPEALVFAAGPYRCVGAQLATLEVEIAVSKLLQFPGLRLSGKPPAWSQRLNIAPLEHLEAYFT